MGTVILIITLVIEAAFAAYCITTRSFQKKTRSILRLGAFAVFVLFTLASVIRWSFRWYGLAVLLLIWAVLGAWAIIGKRAEKKEYQVGRAAVRAVSALLLVCIAVTPALVFRSTARPR